MKICSIDGCEKHAFCKGLCQPHYSKMRVHGNPLWKKPLANQSECSIDGCSRKSIHNELCIYHYEKMKRDGDPNFKRFKINQGECSVDGCSLHAYKKGLCNKHYIRLLRYGREHRVLAKPGDGYVSGGYHLFSCNNNKVFTHRLVMEAYLDRPLDDFEVVHHINGNRLDNRIENLELCSKSAHTTYHSPERMKARWKSKINKP